MFTKRYILKQQGNADASFYGKSSYDDNSTFERKINCHQNAKNDMFR